MATEAEVRIAEKADQAAQRLALAYSIAWDHPDIKRAAGQSSDRRHELALEVAKVASA